MRNMTCTRCGAQFSVEDGATIATCPACGTRFQILNQQAQSSPYVSWEQAARRGGCVADRPCLDSGDDYGKVFYRSWLPEGWTYKVGAAPIERAISVVTPLVPTIWMYPEGEHKLIFHTTSNAFIDPAGAINNQAGVVRGPYGIAVPQQYGSMWLDGLVHYPTSCLDPKTNQRYRDLPDIVSYCDEVAQLLNVQSLTPVADVDTDDWIRARMDKAISEMPPGLRENYWYTWHRRIYRTYVDGEATLVLSEAQISTNGFNRQQPQQQSPFGWGLPFMQQPQMQQMPRMWQVDFEMVLLAPEAQFREVLEEFERVRSTIELGRDFQPTAESLRNLMMGFAAQAQSAVNGAVANMMAEQNASFERRSQIIRDTNEATNQTMREILANNAATNERVARMHSETIRGVNTYMGVDGPVEASIRYDHVYQARPGTGWGTDTYVATEGVWLEPGVDFIELGRI